MEFYEFRSLYWWHLRNSTNKAPNPKQFYLSLLNESTHYTEHRSGVLEACIQFQAEMFWYNNRRPYYRVWPSLIPSMLRLRMQDVPASFFVLPENLRTLAIMLPKEHNPMSFQAEGKTRYVQSVFLIKGEMDTKNNQTTNMMGIWVDVGESFPSGIPGAEGFPLLSYRFIKCRKEYSIEDELLQVEGKSQVNASVGWSIPKETIHDVIRLSACLCLLDREDFDLIFPVLTNRERERWNGTLEDLKTRHQKTYERTHSTGWDVGRVLEEKAEIGPHWRNPSPLALYWTGPGKKTPLYRFRRGTWVKRNLAKVPEGYMDDEEKACET